MTQTIEQRYRAALNTPAESDVFMQLARELEENDQPLYALFYDLSVGGIDRTEALEEVDMIFATAEAEEAFQEACYFYEARTGQDWDNSPSLWDSKAWIEDRAAEIVAGRAA